MSTEITPATAGKPASNGYANQKPVETLNDLLQRSKRQIALALPKHLTAERMIRMALTAFNRTPQLQQCTPLSILGGVIQAAELGLELSGPLGQAYLVPRYNKKIKGMEAVFQVGYRGLIELAMRSGKVDAVPLRVVYTNDHFRYSYGTRQFVEHEPAEEGPPPIQDGSLPYPDNVRAVYAVLYLRGSKRPDFEVMTTGQIEAHRRRYSPDSYESFSPWKTAWEEMAKKTPARRLCKRAPVSVELVKAAMLDEYGEAGVPQNLDLIEAPAGLASLPPPGPSYRTQAVAEELRRQAEARKSARSEESPADVGSSEQGNAYEGGHESSPSTPGEAPLNHEQLAREDLIRDIRQDIADGQQERAATKIQEQAEFLGSDNHAALLQDLQQAKQQRQSPAQRARAGK